MPAWWVGPLTDTCHSGCSTNMPARSPTPMIRSEGCWTGWTKPLPSGCCGACRRTCGGRQGRLLRSFASAGAGGPGSSRARRGGSRRARWGGSRLPRTSPECHLASPGFPGIVRTRCKRVRSPPGLPDSCGLVLNESGPGSIRLTLSFAGRDPSSGWPKRDALTRGDARPGQCRAAPVRLVL